MSPPRDRDLGPGPEWIRVHSRPSPLCRSVVGSLFFSHFRPTRPRFTFSSPFDLRPTAPSPDLLFRPQLTLPVHVCFTLACSLGSHSAVKVPPASLSPHPFPATLPLVATTDGLLHHVRRTSARPGTWGLSPFLALFNGGSWASPSYVSAVNLLVIAARNYERAPHKPQRPPFPAVFNNET